MTPAQKAVLAKAKKDGLTPAEVAGEFLLHDLVQACINQCSKHEVGFRKLSEKQQDTAIAEFTDTLKDSVLVAARILASAGTPTISATLKSIKIDAKSVLTVMVDGQEKYFNDLISKTQDKSDVLIVLYEREYFDAMDDIQSDKQQKPLDLDASSDEKKQEAAAKPAAETNPAARSNKPTNVADIARAVAFKPGELEKAKAFVEQHRTPTTAGIQNMLSIGFNKAEGILAELASQGVIIANKDGSYVMPPLANTGDDVVPGSELPTLDPVDEPAAPAARPLTKAQQKKADAAAKASLEEAAAKVTPTTGQAQPNDFTGTTTLTDELYEAIKKRVIEKQEVSAGGMAVFFGVEIPVIDEAIDRLEMETVISEEDEMGGRVVFDLE